MTKESIKYIYLILKGKYDVADHDCSNLEKKIAESTESERKKRIEWLTAHYRVRQRLGDILRDFEEEYGPIINEL